MYKACIFDLDGTLANTLDSIAYYGNTALKQNGYNEIETEKYKLMVGNGADMLIRRMLKQSANIDDINIIKKIRSDYDRLYERDPLYLVNLYDGIAQLIENLKKMGLKLAILSNKPDDMTNAIAKKLFPQHTFSVIQGQRDGVPKKPNPEAVFSILKEIGITPKECLYIGDSGVDMETGNNAGLTSIGVSWGFRSKTELKENGATYIVDSPKEILEIAKGE